MHLIYGGLGKAGKRNPLAVRARRTLVCRMGFDQLLLLAAVQGLTEFIPVSSSGHLVLAHAVRNDGTQTIAAPILDVALHFGTLLAVMVYFKKDTASLAVGAVDILRHRKGAPRNAALAMSIATLPVLLAAALLLAGGWLDALRQPHIVAWASIVFAVPLYLADRFGRADITLAHIDNRPALMLGLAQMLALVPGASRAGVTIMAARALGFSREAAARYSMLMAMPVILAFALFGVLELLAEGNFQGLGTALIGALLAALFAFAAIDLFLKMTRRLSLLPFVIYRIGLGVAILLVM